MKSIPEYNSDKIFILPRQQVIRRKRISTFIVWSIVLCVFVLSYLILLRFSPFTYNDYTQINIFILKDYQNESLLENLLKLGRRRPNISDDFNNPSCVNVVDEDKFDCYPDTPVDEQKCLARGCCWKALQGFPPLSVPYCYFPSNYTGYKVTKVMKYERGIFAQLQRTIPSGFPKDIKTVNVTVFFLDKEMLRIKITDAHNRRYEIPFPYANRFKHKYDEKLSSQARHSKFWKLYDVQLQLNGEIIITRLLNKQVIFHANLSRMVYADQFIQLSSYLPSQYIYGLGQHRAPLLRSIFWKRFTLFNRDRAPVKNMNLYGSHPFYMALEKDGTSNGVILMNSNAMDIILQPTPAITYRPIGGIFDFFIFLGPKPDQVVQQYTRIIGKTFMPPYWSLGFHLCKYGYNTLNYTKTVWNRTREHGIPFDTQWNDIDYMVNHNDFTYDKIRFKGLPEFVKQLHSIGMHYIPMVDPGISNAEPAGSYPPFDEGLKMDVFVKNSTGQLFIGKVWNKVSTVFPDFTHPKAVDYWTKQFQRYHSEVEFDGAWIDMNEPSNFYNGQIDGCPNSSLENPPYVPGGVEPLYTKTLCMTCQQHYGVHYNLHNLYGLSEAIATNKALKTVRGKRPFIISRSSFPGLGHFAGNWDGDIFSEWEDMRWTIPSILNFNMFGISMVGADICGFEGNTTVELCARWSALGAFYPFSRNHNSDDSRDQDPVALGPKVIEAAKNALKLRYSLLPYLYTLFYRSHIFGETVARPLFFEYPNDPNTYEIGQQFLWGKALMISPALYPNTTEVTVYIPSDILYDYYTGEKYQNTGANITLKAPLNYINLALRGGSIIPSQLVGSAGAITTTEVRLNNFSIYVALDEHKTATGELYWDDGDSLDSIKNEEYSLIHFSAFKNEMISSVVIGHYIIKPHMETVTIMGCDVQPKSVTANDVPVYFEYNKTNKVLTISKLNLTLMEQNIIKWE